MDLPKSKATRRHNTINHQCFVKCVAAVLAGICIGYWILTRFEITLWKPEYPLNILLVGDWGRDGSHNQSLVATQMGKVGEKLAIDFVISTGDNFYDTGLSGTGDPQFATSFTNIYTAPSLQKRWYAVLGNHDYMGNVLAQLDAALVLRDHRWFCRRQYQLKRYLCQPPLSGLCNYAVDFFFIDTTPFINEYSLPGIHEMFDWRGLAPRDIQLQHQMEALDQALEQSTATWKIVVGHHTIRSFGHHGDSKDLISKVLPLLEAHGVNAYINGHDHCLQHIKSNDSKVHFLTSGGGSKAWQGIQKAKKSELHFAYDGQGFLAMSLNERSLNFDFYDAFGNNLHSIHIGK